MTRPFSEKDIHVAAGKGKNGFCFDAEVHYW
jgi:hypothetical protein